MLILIWIKQEVFGRYTKTNFTEGRIQLAMYFITQATPDTWRKLWRLQAGPQSPLSNLVKEDFKVYIKSNSIIEPHCLLFVVGSKNQCRLQWIHHLRWKVYDNLIFLVTKYKGKPSWEGKQRAEILRLNYRFIDPWNIISLVKFLLSFCILFIQISLQLQQGTMLDCLVKHCYLIVDAFKPAMRTVPHRGFTLV